MLAWVMNLGFAASGSPFSPPSLLIPGFFPIGGRVIQYPKLQAEVKNIPFDFISNLGVSETISTKVVTASVYSGVDAAPSGVINGAATSSGTVVTQSVQAGVVGVVYELLCKITTSAGQTLELAAFFVVQPDLP